MGFDIGFDFDNIFILQRGGDSNPIDVNTPIEFERFDMHVVCLRWSCSSRSVARATLTFS